MLFPETPNLSSSGSSNERHSELYFDAPMETVGAILILIVQTEGASGAKAGNSEFASAPVPCERGLCVIWRASRAGNRDACVVRARVAHIFLLHAPAAWTCSRTRMETRRRTNRHRRTRSSTRGSNLLRPADGPTERKHRPVNLE